jgi:hypothetical protein
MIRQAHTYLVGALSGVVVIGIAIAAFVVLVSAQVFHDLPIPALSSSDQKAAAVSQGKALTSPDHAAVAVTPTAQPNHAAANANANAGGPTGANGANNPQPTNGHPTAGATPTTTTEAPAELVESTPSTGGGNESSPSSSGTSGSHNNGNTASSPPASNTSQPSSGNSSGGNSGGGQTTTGTSGSSGGSGKTSTPPTQTSNPTTGSEGGSTTTSPPSTPVTTAKPSEAISESVNNVVGTVDEATGGTLGGTGVTHVTEEVVEGVVGPESVVGKTVDGVGEVVGGLLGKHGE